MAPQLKNINYSLGDKSMNKKYSLFLVMGLFSSFAFADPAPDYEHSRIFEYRCNVETCSTCHSHGHEGAECWVEGTVCQDDYDRHSEGGRKCQPKDDSIKIRCTNGFELSDEYAATATKGDTLWVNGDEKDKIATLRVEDFVKQAKRDNYFRLEADLLISKKRNEADRLNGKCTFKKKDYHGLY